MPHRGNVGGWAIFNKRLHSINRNYLVPNHKRFTPFYFTK